MSQNSASKRFKPYKPPHSSTGRRTRAGLNKTNAGESQTLQFVLPVCAECGVDIPPNEKSRGQKCSKCWSTSGDGRVNMRKTPITNTDCTKCRTPLEKKPTHKRCRRCREHLLRVNREKGVLPERGHDLECTRCRLPMVPGYGPLCYTCERSTLPPKVEKEQAGRIIRKRKQAISIPAGPSTSSSSPDLRPGPSVSRLSPTTIREQTLLEIPFDTPSSSTYSQLSLTPLSIGETFGSSSPYTSYHGSPYPTTAGTIQGPCPPIPQYSDGENTHGYRYDNFSSSQSQSPVAFSTPLSSIPLPEDPQDGLVSHDGYNQHFPSFPTEYFSSSSASFHEAHLLLRNSMFPEETPHLHHPQDPSLHPSLSPRNRQDNQTPFDGATYEQFLSDLPSSEHAPWRPC